jgi:hypothetical protein
MSHRLTPEWPRSHSVDCPLHTTDVHAAVSASRQDRAARARWRLAARLAATAGLVALAVAAPDASRAIDRTGLSDRLTQEQRDWVHDLRAGNGVSCCDDADGIDPEWDILGGDYRVRYGGQWLTVAPHALLTQPNRLGVARAWIAHGEGETFVRCFLPGPTT